MPEMISMLKRNNCGKVAYTIFWIFRGIQRNIFFARVGWAVHNSVPSEFDITRYGEVVGNLSSTSHRSKLAKDVFS